MPNAHEPKKAYFPSNSNWMKVEEIRASILYILRVTKWNKSLETVMYTNNHHGIELTRSHFHSLGNSDKLDHYKDTYGLTICIL